jgi:hypothetical protein
LGAAGRGKVPEHLVLDATEDETFRFWFERNESEWSMGVPYL